MSKQCNIAMSKQYNIAMSKQYNIAMSKQWSEMSKRLQDKIVVTPKRSVKSKNKNIVTS